MDWNDYQIFNPEVDRPLHELPRGEARAAHDRLMAARSARVAALKRLARASGVDLEGLDALQQLNDWFVSSVESDDGAPGRLSSDWYSVVNDIGLYLGEEAIARSGGKLRWEFFTRGKRDIAYQRSVIMGFDVPNPKYNVDFDLAVATYGHRIVQGLEHDRAFFVHIFENALAKV